MEAQIVINEAPIRKIRMALEGDDMENKVIIEYATNTHYDIYPAMKKFPASSAVMIKILLGRFILSKCFKETKNREHFTYWAKAVNPDKRRLFPITTEGLLSFKNKMVYIVNSIANDDLAPWQCLSYCRRLLAWIELIEVGITSSITKIQIAQLILYVKDMVFQTTYSNVVKICHNGDCMNVCRTQCSCRDIRYCSAACQNADWKRHKQTCQFIRQSAPAA